MLQLRQEVSRSRVVRDDVKSIYETIGGMEGLVRLAEAWHELVVNDEIVGHAFSHGFHPQHTERLAAYWAEALGGPATYSEKFGDETSVVRMHSGNGPHEEMDQRAIACFDQALENVGIARDDRLGRALHDYFAWATTTTMSRYHDSEDQVPSGLSIPKWSWDGPLKPTFPEGRAVRQDLGAQSASADLPAFIARPADAPVYHGFPLLPGSEKDGFVFGVITDPKGDEPVPWGDAYVVAPDGTRAGIVWSMDGSDMKVVCPPEPGRWGVYAFRFKHPVRSDADLVKNLHEVLPRLKQLYAEARALLQEPGS